MNLQKHMEWTNVHMPSTAFKFQILLFDLNLIQNTNTLMIKVKCAVTSPFDQHKVILSTSHFWLIIYFLYLHLFPDPE